MAAEWCSVEGAAAGHGQGSSEWGDARCASIGCPGYVLYVMYVCAVWYGMIRYGMDV